MLDRFDDLKKMVQNENISMHLNESLADEESQVNNDRELIVEFLENTKEVQKCLQEMESNNSQMRGLVNELISDKKSAAN